MRIKLIRDLVTICVGSGLLISQVVLQFTQQDKSPDLALIAAALSLLGVVPLFQLGDRQADKTNDDDRPKHASRD